MKFETKEDYVDFCAIMIRTRMSMSVTFRATCPIVAYDIAEEMWQEKKRREKERRVEHPVPPLCLQVRWFGGRPYTCTKAKGHESTHTAQEGVRW